jgi:hypothetical protein
LFDDETNSDAPFPAGAAGKKRAGGRQGRCGRAGQEGPSGSAHFPFAHRFLSSVILRSCLILVDFAIISYIYNSWTATMPFA